MKSKNIIIAFDGPDGTGKTTLVNLLVDFMQLNNMPTSKIREPGSDSLMGDKIYSMLKAMPRLHPIAQGLLALASRSQMLSEMKASKKNRYYVADRWIFSLGYQTARMKTYAQKCSMWFLGEEIHDYVTDKGDGSDIIFYVTCTPKVQFNRLKARQTTDHFEEPTYLKKVNKEIAKKVAEYQEDSVQPIITLDTTNLPVAATFREVIWQLYSNGIVKFPKHLTVDDFLSNKGLL